MAENVSVRGALTIGGGACGGCGGSATTLPLALGGAGGACADAGLQYEAAIPAGSLTIATEGLIGQRWQDLDVTDQFRAIEFLRILVVTGRVRVRFNPTRPVLTGAAVIPAGGVTSGAVTFTVTTSDGTTTPVTVTFSGGTNTPALVVAAINAAFGAAGVQPPPDMLIARLVSGVLGVSNPGIGQLAWIQQAAGAPVDLGLGTVLVRVDGTANVLPDLEGLALLQFPRSPNAPVKVQFSGAATIDIVVAGRVSA